MVRVKSSVPSKRRKKRLLKKAKGQFGHRSTRFSQAKRSVVRGMVYEYRDRKVKKREFRSLWIIRVNAACQEAGMAYSRFINGLKKAEVEIDRKMLAEIAVSSPAAFKKLVKIAQEALSGKKEEAPKKETKTKTKTTKE